MDAPASDSNSDVAPDDAFSVVCGDLGLGECSRSFRFQSGFELGFLSDPAGLSSNSDSEKKAPEQKDVNGDARIGDATQQNGQKCRSKSLDDARPSDKNDGTDRKESKRRSKKSRSKSPGDEHQTAAAAGADEPFPTYADVPYGTSLRQQRKLYEQNLDSILKKHTYSTNSDSMPCVDDKKKLTGEEIDKKLFSALQEVEDLKQDLDVCRQRLDAKYHAIAILKKQAEENNHELVTNELKAKEASMKLVEAGGGCVLVTEEQYGLEVGETPRETMQRRYLRVCQENAMLTSQLEARSEELRRANAHRMALRRERDELLALLDIKERSRYHNCHSQSSEEEYGQYNTMELAVLGACQCRGSQTEPCGCGYAAANLMREVTKLREQNKVMQQRRDEAYMTVDAYRIAFEEQLQKSRALTQELATIATTASRAVKTKAAIKWLISVLADEEYPPVSKDGGDGTNHTQSSLESLTLPELVTLMTEMLHEKKEALAHQKLAGQVLSARVQELERKLQSVSDADGDVFQN